MFRCIFAVVHSSSCSASKALTNRWSYRCQFSVGVNYLGGTTLTMTQVCEITGWKSEVLSQWIKAGLLPAKYILNGATKATLIRMDDLIRFMQDHLVLADVASAGKTTSSFLIKSLESRDCPVVSFKNDAGVRFGVLMRHADLANVIRKSTAANECSV